MVIFSLTGGICSGKSRITKLFKAKDIPMVDADIIAREVVELETEGYRKLFSTFGSSYFLHNGYLNRKKLADLIFFNNKARKLLDSIMIPLIIEEARIQIKRLQDAGNSFVGFDSALIVEMGYEDQFRPLIVVHCAPEMQIARMIRRRLLTRDEAVARLEAQLPREEKIKVADFVIDSSGPVEETEQQAQLIIQKIKTY